MGIQGQIFQNIMKILSISLFKKRFASNKGLLPQGGLYILTEHLTRLEQRNQTLRIGVHVPSMLAPVRDYRLVGPCFIKRATAAASVLSKCGIAAVCCG